MAWFYKIQRGVSDMRKVKNGIILVLLGLALFALSGCGGEEEDPYIGTWKMSAGKVNGVSLPSVQIEEQLGTISLVIQEKGVVKKEGIGLDATGKWKESEKGITISDKDGTNEVVFTLSEGKLSGNIKGIELIFSKEQSQSDK